MSFIRRAKMMIMVFSVLLVFAKHGESQSIKTSNELNNENEKLSQEGLMIREYEVFGMDCPGCHRGLEKLIEKIPSVQESQANWKKKRLFVIIRPGEELNDEDVYDAIKRANFTAGERIK